MDRENYQDNPEYSDVEKSIIEYALANNNVVCIFDLYDTIRKPEKIIFNALRDLYRRGDFIYNSYNDRGKICYRLADDLDMVEKVEVVEPAETIEVVEAVESIEDNEEDYCESDWNDSWNNSWNDNDIECVNGESILEADEIVPVYVEMDKGYPKEYDGAYEELKKESVTLNSDLDKYRLEEEFLKKKKSELIADYQNGYAKIYRRMYNQRFICDSIDLDDEGKKLMYGKGFPRKYYGKFDCLRDFDVDDEEELIELEGKKIGWMAGDIRVLTDEEYERNKEELGRYRWDRLSKEEREGRWEVKVDIENGKGKVIRIEDG